MSLHSHTRCWVHFVWTTLKREKLLNKDARAQASKFLYDYAKSKSIPMEATFVNADHVHALIDLPAGMTIENAAKLLKGASSHWINQERVTPAKFSWGRGYGAFSVSQSHIQRMKEYIRDQEEHHRTKSFNEEYTRILGAYGLREEEENR